MKEVETIFGKHTKTRDSDWRRRGRKGATYCYYNLQTVHLTVEYLEGRVTWREFYLGGDYNEDYESIPGGEEGKRIHLDNESRRDLKNLEEACRKYKPLNESKSYIP